MTSRTSQRTPGQKVRFSPRSVAAGQGPNLCHLIDGRSKLVVSPLFSSEDDGTRTRNHRIDSPPISRSNSNSHKQIATSDAGRCSAGCSDEHGEGGICGADLACVVHAWPTLPDALRRAVLAIIGADAAGGGDFK